MFAFMFQSGRVNSAIHQLGPNFGGSPSTKEVFVQSWFQVHRQTDLSGARKEPSSCPLVMEAPLAQFSARVGKQGSTGLYFVLD